jgi:hypothetical protein
VEGKTGGVEGRKWNGGRRLLPPKNPDEKGDF